MNTKQARSGPGRQSRPLLIYFSGAMLILMMVGALTLSLLKSKQTVDIYEPLVNAAVELKFNGAMAFQELKHDPAASSALPYLDATLQITRAMLNGGNANDHIGNVKAIEDESLRSRIELAQGNIEAILAGMSKPSADASFTALMDDFVQHAEDLEDRLRTIVAEDISTFARLQISLILFCCLFGAFGGWVLYQFETKLRKANVVNEQQIWQKSGETQLNETIRGDRAVTEIVNDSLAFLADYLGAQVGVVYLPSALGDLRMVGSHAYTARKHLANEWKLGEGLVGQAALEKKSFLLTDVPTDYMPVASGLGASQPRNIFVMPLLHNGELKGVIELAALKAFSAADQAFLNQVGASISIAIHSAQARMRVAELLQETQAQAEELEAQQEELRQTNEELSQQTTVLMESQERLRLQQAELEETNAKLEERSESLQREKSIVSRQNKDLETARQIVEQKARDLEITSKYKSEFLANMSHELRTPLNSILILSKLLAGNKDQNLAPKQIEFSQTIHESGTDLLNLINEILDHSKIESGKLELVIEPVDLRVMLAQTGRTFTPIAQQKGLDFQINIAPEVGTISSDRQRLDQVLKNLISNALKFTEKGGVTIDVCIPSEQLVKRTMLDMNASAAVALIVSDTGIGVPKSKQQIIFEAFQQADGATDRKYGGTGLGLSISRELSRCLGGSIVMDSEEGHGSQFSVVLPIAGPPARTIQDRIEPARHAEPTLAHANGHAHSVHAHNGAAADHTHPTDAAAAIVETIAEVAAESALPELSHVAAEHDPTMQSHYVPDDRRQIKSGDKSILIVEDDPRFAQILLNLARERGFKGIVAEDGRTGLHLADYYSPSAIILDLGLPDMDGIAVMERLKESLPLRHIPVHVISGHEKKFAALKMGALGYLTKPANLDQLDHAIGKIEDILSRPVKKVLLVEDDSGTRTGIIGLIEDENVQITTLSSGRQALARLKTEVFDCMILDLSIPDMTGMEVLERVRRDTELAELPVIVFTGKELSSQERTNLDRYANRVIVKGPTSSERLLDETSLFLHRVEQFLPEDKRRMIHMLHDKEIIFRDKSVLVVDDDMRNVFALSNVLEEKGLKTIIAKNGHEALSALEDETRIHVVLMDIMMPGMDGYEAMRRIRSQERFKAMPIIALTAKAMQGDRAKCIEAGANDYLSKPVDTDKLLSMLRVWLYQQKNGELEA
jgi:CheY-like chemotaxis protein